MHTALRVTLLTGTAFALLTGAAVAAPAVGLTGDKTLVMFDTETLAVSGTMDVSGVDRLHGIDVRPADGMLYGVTGDGKVVTIDTASGAATEKSTLSETLADGVWASVDFNPVADRLRIVGSDGTNHRANVDDGAVTIDGSLAYESADMHAGEAPNIVAVAYTNSVGKPEATAMYDIDATIAGLIQQIPPNDGVLKAIGKLGATGADNWAFDISATADLQNTAWLVAGKTLHTVDLATGAATVVGDIDSAALRDIAILP
jgi:hypothetical protein